MDLAYGDYRVQAVYGHCDGALCQELVDFWIRAGAIRDRGQI